MIRFCSTVRTEDEQMAHSAEERRTVALLSSWEMVNAVVAVVVVALNDEEEEKVFDSSLKTPMEIQEDKSPHFSSGSVKKSGEASS